MMKCGHAANSTLDGKPCCVICFGISAGADEVADDRPDLTGRIAKCGTHGETPSDWRVAFFRYQPSQQHDSFYCGCHGWD